MEEGDTSIDSIPSDTEQQTHCSPQRCVDTNNDQNVLWCLKCKRAFNAQIYLHTTSRQSLTNQKT